MKFQYIGDKYGEGPREIRFLNKYDFVLDGEFVDIPVQAHAVKANGATTFIREGQQRPKILSLNKLNKERMESEFSELMEKAAQIKETLDQNEPETEIVEEELFEEFDEKDVIDETEQEDGLFPDDEDIDKKEDD